MLRRSLRRTLLSDRLVSALETLKDPDLLVEAPLLVEALPQPHMLVHYLALIFSPHSNGGDILGIVLEGVAEVLRKDRVAERLPPGVTG